SAYGAKAVAKPSSHPSARSCSSDTPQCSPARRRASIEAGIPMPAMRVLVAEDDETKAVQTQSMLREAEDADVTVDWVSSAAETLRHIARGGYDAYLVDVTLGKASGLDVLEQAI